MLVVSAVPAYFIIITHLVDKNSVPYFHQVNYMHVLSILSIPFALPVNENVNN